MNWERLSALIIVIVVASLVLWDLLAYFIWGNSATLSKNCLNISVRHPWFALMFAFCFGTLIGHLFLPQTK